MANSYLTRNISSAGSSQKGTLSMWVKRSEAPASGSNAYPRIYQNEYSNSNFFEVFFRNGGELQVDNYASDTTILQLRTNRKFRDFSAWYHILISIDTTQSTAADRCKIYINGTQETSLAIATYPSQNTNLLLTNSGYQQHIGYSGYSSEQYFGGYISHAAYVDGTALAPTSFGQTDSTSGIWKFKAPSGITWGTNGFHLKFENSGALGTDSSGNTNTFTVNGNLKQSLSTPSNVYCAWNPLYPAGMTFANGNTKLTQGSAWKSMGGTLAVSSGKWYWEIKNSGNYAYLGFADIQLFNEGCYARESFTTGAATTATAYSMLSSSGSLNSVATSGSQNEKTYNGASYGNDIIGIALNLDDNEATWYKNGTALNSGTPLSIDAGTYTPAASLHGNNCEANFGNGYFGTTAITSAGSNGNGSLFEYDVPSGYYALNTKNINTYG